jgi:hypothetical protein
MVNRHGAGSRALLFYGGGPKATKVHHNLVKRTRQGGLGGNKVHNNEVYVDSWATNSFGITITEEGEAHNNRVFGTGYHVVAFGWGSKQKFHHNFIHLEGQKPSPRFAEYGEQVSLNGFRLTQYGGSQNPYHDNLYYDNTIIVTGREGCEGRGVQFFSDPHVENLVFRNNVIKATVADSQTKQLACVVTQGLQDRTNEHLPIIYKDCTFISNICNVRFGDYYGVGSNHRFYGCKFVRIGQDPRYKTFLWDTHYPSKNHVVLDPTFDGGASLESILLGEGDHGLTVKWTVTIKTAPGASVSIKDADGKDAFTGKADAEGALPVALAECLLTAQGKTLYTPHTIIAEKEGKTATKQITVDKKQQVALGL